MHNSPLLSRPWTIPRHARRPALPELRGSGGGESNLLGCMELLVIAVLWPGA